MKKSLLTTALAGCLISGLAVTATVRSQFSPNTVVDVTTLTPADKISAQPGMPPVLQMQGKRQAPARVEAYQGAYTAVGQKYHEGYTFVYEGGDIVNYQIDIKVEGDKATISNLFNLAAQSTEWSIGEDYDVVGTYDADAKTITIPTVADVNNGTQVGNIGGYITGVLLCGEVNEQGQMASDSELVFNVIGDMEAITTDQSFGMANYYGETPYGFQTMYRGFYATLPQDEPKLIAFNKSLNLGQAWPGMELTKAFTLVNISNAEVDFAAEVTDEEGVFSAEPEVGSVPAMGTLPVNVKFNGQNSGDYEAILSINYEGISTEPEPVEVLLGAEVMTLPDYSGAVKSGDFTFSTSVAFPFEMTERDGHQVARSTVNGQRGDSDFTVKFTVPEGNLGVFSWKGMNTVTSMYRTVGGYFVDNASDPAFSVIDQGDVAIDGSIEFAPGEHNVRFMYQVVQATMNEADGLYVYDLELVNTPAVASLAENLNEDLDMGSYILKEGLGAEDTQYITIRNRGTNPLSVSSVSSDCTNFTAQKPEGAVALYETLQVPVTFKSTTEGTFSGTITIETSAGTLTTAVKAVSREMPDFASIVTEGKELITEYYTDERDPFIVENGVARNANAGEPDDVAGRTAMFRISFTVPEGKRVDIRWDGKCNGCVDPTADPSYRYQTGDQAIFNLRTNNNQFTKQAYEGEDAGNGVFTNDPMWVAAVMCAPGDHYIEFSYQKNGDGVISEKDCLEISNFRLIMNDMKENDCELSETELDFGAPVFSGENRYSQMMFKIMNTGSQPLEVTGVESAGPFLGLIPSWPIYFANQGDIGVLFYPQDQEGEFTEDVVFHTTAGDYTVKCHASTKDRTGMLVTGDVENLGCDWFYYDADGDGYAWDLGTNLWGTMTSWVHGGINCFGSASVDNYTMEPITPDNWAVSPEFTVPADGAVLNWYAAEHHETTYGNHYSVYVVDADEASNNDFTNATLLFEETLGAEACDEWQGHNVEIPAEMAGQPVRVAFRHHDCSGKYLMKIDDIFVYTHEKWSQVGVEGIISDGRILSTEVYDMNGMRLRSVQKGLNIIRSTMEDGSVKTSKIFVK